MAYQSIWYFTDLPDDVVNILNNDLFYKYSSRMEDSKLHGDKLDKKKRDSKNTWIPSTHNHTSRSRIIINLINNI